MFFWDKIPHPHIENHCHGHLCPLILPESQYRPPSPTQDLPYCLSLKQANDIFFLCNHFSLQVKNDKP